MCQVQSVTYKAKPDRCERCGYKYWIEGGPKLCWECRFKALFGDFDAKA